MHVSIREVRVYTCIVIKILLSFFAKKFKNLLFSYMYLFNLKRKVKNKAHVEASICEAYIVEEISIFISYYFESQLRIRINHIPRHDDGGEVPLSENLSIFSNLRRPAPKNVVKGRYFSEIKLR
jgi:hypothetical protein